jgi:hypothetical protein
LGFMCWDQFLSFHIKIQVDSENHMDGTLLPAHYLLFWHHKRPNSTISSLLTPEFRIKWSLTPEFYGSTAPVLPFSLISRDKKRVTENYIFKAPNPSFPKSHLMWPYFHGHYREVCHTWSVLDLVHIWFQVTQAPLQGTHASCVAQTASNHRARPTTHSP